MSKVVLSTLIGTLIVFIISAAIPPLFWVLASFMFWEILPLSAFYVLLRVGALFGVIMAVWFLTDTYQYGDYK